MGSGTTFADLTESFYDVITPVFEFFVVEMPGEKPAEVATEIRINKTTEVLEWKVVQVVEVVGVVKVIIVVRVVIVITVTPIFVFVVIGVGVITVAR